MALNFHTECLIFHSPCVSLCDPCSGSGAVRCYAADRTPVPEPDTPQKEKAADVLLQSSDLWAGEAFPPAEIPGQRRASSPGQESENDRRTGQNLVPEPQDEVEVIIKIRIQSQSCVHLHLQPYFSTVYTCKPRHCSLHPPPFTPVSHVQFKKSSPV